MNGGAGRGRVSLMTFAMLPDILVGAMTPAKIVRAAAENGIRRLDLMDLSERAAQKYAAAMRAGGMRAGCYIATVPCFGSGGKVLAGLERACGIARILGAELLMLVPVGGGDRARMRALGRGEALQMLAGYFRTAVRLGAERGIRILFENTPYDFSLMQTQEECGALLGEADGLELAFDTGNPLTCGQDPLQFCRALLGRIGHVHMRDARLQQKKIHTCLYGQGSVPLPALRDALCGGGYDGLFALEYCRPAGLLAGERRHSAFIGQFMPLFDAEEDTERKL